MGVTAQLAGMIARGAANRTTARTTAVVTRSILDWVGCAISGSASEAARLAGEYLRESGSAGELHVVAGSLRLSAGAAAWLNGIQGHVDDFDDSGSHPASYLTPTVLALGEQLDAPGSRIIEAWAIGYEVATRLGEGVRPDRGWHTTSLYGTLGAAAAASVMLGLDSAQAENALGIAASSTSGLMRNFGSMTKAVHPANASRAGIEAARLARIGFEATPGIVEGKYGLVDCFGGEHAHLPSIAARLDEPLLVDRQPPVIKAWPTCTGTQRSLTAIFAFLEANRPAPGDIVRVDHYGPLIPGEGPLQYSSVSTPLQGKFSLEYTIAAALLDGRIDHDSYSPERFARVDIQDLMTRVHRHRSPEALLHSHRTAPGLDVDRLVIELRGGVVHDLKLGARRTLDGAEVEEKFLANAVRGRTSASAQELLAELRDLEGMTSVAAFMTRAAAPQAADGGESR